MCAAEQLKCYYNPEDLGGEDWERNDEEIAALDLQSLPAQWKLKDNSPT